MGSTLFNKSKPQKTNLVAPGSDLGGEIFDLRADLKTIFNSLAPITVDEFTNPPVADVDAIKTAFTSVASPVTYSGAQLNGVVGAGTMAIPRNITVTTGAGGTPADVPANLTVTGTYKGKPQSEVIAISQTAATVAGTKPFDKVTSLALDAGQGTGGTLEVGFGAALGMSFKPKARGGGTLLVREIAVGALVTNGAITALGLYTPNGAPNGTNDYAIYYEYDPDASLP